MIGRRQLRCSFCGKQEHDIAKLVAGPRVRICDECVTVASRLMSAGPPDVLRPSRDRWALWRGLPARIRAWLHRADARRVRSAAASS
jgi:ATP-dependent protease Clp ATPase subunit